ncbi:type VI secretion system protein TssA [Limnohabitans sp. DCL3]|uniref:type VI secretion system protein TssA n=1 Tax=Limnohabitans sp. DCL3 TaxID=3374103 RepID=UPI003A88BDA6
MIDLEDINARTKIWCESPVSTDAPCGSDLEYDNDFLALIQAAAGKAETQFAPAESPDWSAVVQMAEAILDRSRDLRVAVMWGRGMVRLHGWPAIAPGLALIQGLMAEQWDHVHPLPDPDDGDLYGRVNALSILADVEGLLGDLRVARIFADRSMGEITGRSVEVAVGLSSAYEGDPDISSAVLGRMLADAVRKAPEVRSWCEQAQAAAHALVHEMQERLGDDAPPLDPVLSLLKAVTALLPSRDDDMAEDAVNGNHAVEDGGEPIARAGQGLSGSVRSREEAIRAIDLVCEFLERTEPSNPAPLYLRRGRELISHNFLQLMKILAPEALSEVARVVGVDPDSIELPGSSWQE